MLNIPSNLLLKKVLMKKNMIFLALALACLSLFYIWKYKQYKSPATGMLILLNGTSSSGKSAILDSFYKSNPIFKVFKVDDYFPTQALKKAKELGWEEHNGVEPWVYLANYVEQKTGHPNFDTQVRAYLFHETSPMYQEAHKALRTGHKIIMDTVFEYDPEYERFSDFFKEFNCFKVLVYCPLDVLIERVQTRNRSGKKEEIRTAFQSFEQFPALYKPQEHEHEPVVDVVSSDSIKTALDTAIQELVAYKIPEKYMQPLQNFKLNFIKQFKLDKLSDIKLVARHHYDLILNSATHTPEKLAELIEKNLLYPKGSS